MVRVYNDNPHRRCQAMIDAGIADSESREGIQFCTGGKETDSRCPYSTCIIAEGGREHGAVRIRERTKRKADLAKGLYHKGVSVEDIALMMCTDRKNVWRWLRRK